MGTVRPDFGSCAGAIYIPYISSCVPSNGSHVAHRFPTLWVIYCPRNSFTLIHTANFLTSAWLHYIYYKYKFTMCYILDLLKCVRSYNLCQCITILSSRNKKFILSQSICVCLKICCQNVNIFLFFRSGVYLWKIKLNLVTVCFWYQNDFDQIFFGISALYQSFFKNFNKILTAHLYYTFSKFLNVIHIFLVLHVFKCTSHIIQ